jgi:hypothetical protein
LVVAPSNNSQQVAEKETVGDGSKKKEKMAIVFLL